MKFFYNLKLSAKLIISFFLILSFTAALGIFSILQLVKVNNNVVEISSNWLPSVQAVLDMKATLARYRTQTFQHVLATDANRAQFDQLMTESTERFTKYHKLYASLVTTPEEQALMDDLTRQWRLYCVENEKVLVLSREGKLDEAVVALRGRSTSLNRSLIDTIEKLVELNTEGSAKATKESEASYLMSRNLIIGLLVASIFLGLVLALWIARIISAPIKAAVMVAQTVAAGDLTSKIEVKSKDETGQLLGALKTMNTNLIKIVSDVRSGTETIATASTQIAQGNLDLSSRTEEQASSLEETASSMEEMTSTVQQNADNAKQASKLAASASDTACKGGEVVAKVVTTMGLINDSAKRIEQITSVIDSIAFQTNILALNAAVEAARAGEQGRGFAVVAAEVRNLAQKSAGAAKEIKGLIDASVENVNAGTRLVDQAGATMQDIVASVKHVTDIVEEITAASNEQASSIQQINSAVMQMDTVTQQNASLVEEAAAASESMQDQAASLAKAVSVFKL